MRQQTEHDRSRQPGGADTRQQGAWHSAGAAALSSSGLPLPLQPVRAAGAAAAAAAAGAAGTASSSSNPLVVLQRVAGSAVATASSLTSHQQVLMAQAEAQRQQVLQLLQWTGAEKEKRDSKKRCTEESQLQQQQQQQQQHEHQRQQQQQEHQLQQQQSVFGAGQQHSSMVRQHTAVSTHSPPQHQHQQLGDTAWVVGGTVAAHLSTAQTSMRANSIGLQRPTMGARAGDGTDPRLSYPQAEASHTQVLADRQLFMTCLKRLHDTLASRCRVPVVAGQELDLWQLYRQVGAHGGLAAVVRDRRWSDVCQPFNFPATFTSRSFTMRKYYNQLLWHFEQVYMHGATGPLLDPPVPEQPTMSAHAPAPQKKRPALERHTSSTGPNNLGAGAYLCMLSAASPAALGSARAIDAGGKRSVPLAGNYAPPPTMAAGPPLAALVRDGCGLQNGPAVLARGNLPPRPSIVAGTPTPLAAAGRGGGDVPQQRQQGPPPLTAMRVDKGPARLDDVGVGSLVQGVVTDRFDYGVFMQLHVGGMVFRGALYNPLATSPAPLQTAATVPTSTEQRNTPVPPPQMLPDRATQQPLWPPQQQQQQWPGLLQQPHPQQQLQRQPEPQLQPQHQPQHQPQQQLKQQGGLLQALDGQAELCFARQSLGQWSWPGSVDMLYSQCQEFGPGSEVMVDGSVATGPVHAGGVSGCSRWEGCGTPSVQGHTLGSQEPGVTGIMFDLHPCLYDE